MCGGVGGGGGGGWLEGWPLSHIPHASPISHPQSTCRTMSGSVSGRCSGILQPLQLSYWPLLDWKCTATVPA